ncbi:Na+/H+ antiporter NhaA [Plantactinospora solaniradicis]|uniref:Na(+)/H(+) antiporter NhaA n=1 Tax=Plantactinospora solaniradicis TaxID=1723736 RepID=A0ABW1K6N7_9ACTN
MTDRQRPVQPPGAVRRFFQRGSWPEARFVADVLRTETVGGGLLLFGAVIALGWANSPWSDSYLALGRYVPWSDGDVVHLDLSLAGWAADGLLAIFFFVVGLELKREFVVGDLRDPRRAVVPVLAALGGMALPALIYVAVIAASGSGAYAGWAVPMATDIAFALAVLAVIGSHLPHGLRAFLLTLAVVDDLIAILVIALFYTDQLSLPPLLGALVTIGVFGLLVQRRLTRWWVLLPLGVLSWVLMHASGVHATVAGVLLGFTVPVLTRPGERRRPAEHLEHRWRPVSAGAAVPIFAFFAAGVALRGTDLGGLIREPVVLGVAAGLIVGKTLGIFGTTYLLSRFTRAELDEGIGWPDLFGVALLAGIGFTVSLLIGELAFGSGGEEDRFVKAAVLAGSLISAVLASLVLTLRNAKHRRLSEAESRDEDADGVPDVYQRPEPGDRRSGAAD